MIISSLVQHIREWVVTQTGVTGSRISEAQKGQFRAHPPRPKLSWLPLSATAVTPITNEAEDAYVIHSSTPYLRELLDQYHNLVFELSNMLCLSIKSLQQPAPPPPTRVAVRKQSGEPITAAEKLLVMQELAQAHMRPDCLRPLISANNRVSQDWRTTLGLRPVRPLRFANMQGDLFTPTPTHRWHPDKLKACPDRYHTYHNQVMSVIGASLHVDTADLTGEQAATAAATAFAPMEGDTHYLLTTASKQDMVGALSAAMTLGGVIETRGAQLQLGVPKSPVGAGQQDVVWFVEIDSPEDPTIPHLPEVTMANQALTGLQHIFDMCIFMLRAAAAAGEGTSMLRMPDANAMP
ncbi:hypothetical protein V8C86DRAFT_2443380 [Haematococcus lacustris]